MDFLISIILIILFIVLMIFILSMALLTPYIGRKNFISVIVIGFIIGAVGGAFLLTPVYNDIPDMSRGFFQTFSTEPETIFVDVSTHVDINEFISKVKKQKGVKAVRTHDIELRTDNFTDSQARNIRDRISILNPNFTNSTVHTNGTILIKFKSGTNPKTSIDQLSEWLIYTSEINTRYSIITVEVDVDPRELNNVKKYIDDGNVVIKDVKGPVEDQVKGLENFLPNSYVMIFLCGILGISVGLIGIFIDEITRFFENLKDYLNEHRR